MFPTKVLVNTHFYLKANINQPHTHLYSRIGAPFHNSFGLKATEYLNPKHTLNQIRYRKKFKNNQARVPITDRDMVMQIKMRFRILKFLKDAATDHIKCKEQKVVAWHFI